MRRFIFGIFTAFMLAVVALGCSSSHNSSSGGTQVSGGGQTGSTLTFVTTPTIARGYNGQPQDTFVIAGGGTSPYTIKVTNGSLPTGLAGSMTSDGRFELAGTPTTNGAFSFSLEVTDASQATATRTFSWNITDPIVIATTSTLPNASVGQAYSFHFTASGGTGSGFGSWSLVTGTLPPGLSLSASTGNLSGTPSGPSATSYAFEVTCTDSGADGAVGFMGAAPPNALGSVNLTVQ